MGHFPYKQVCLNPGHQQFRTAAPDELRTGTADPQSSTCAYGERFNEGTYAAVTMIHPRAIAVPVID